MDVVHQLGPCQQSLTEAVRTGVLKDSHHPLLDIPDVLRINDKSRQVREENTVDMQPDRSQEGVPSTEV
jgi:hypothetical protein